MLALMSLRGTLHQNLNLKVDKKSMNEKTLDEGYSLMEKLVALNIVPEMWKSPKSGNMEGQGKMSTAT